MGDRTQTSPQQQTTPIFTSALRNKTNAEYKLGPPTKPANIDHSRPSPDDYKVRTATKEDYVQLVKWTAYLEGVRKLQGVPFAPHNNIPEGIAAYEHYLNGNGADRQFSYEKYVKQDAAGRKTLESAITDASTGVEKLYFDNNFAAQQAQQAAGKPVTPIKFSFTGSGICAGMTGDPELNARFPYPETEDWQKTIGTHFIWMSGDVTVTMDSNGKPQFEMDLKLHAEDKYQYVHSLKDIASGIDDAENVQLEVSGLAMPYMHYSYLTRTVKWTGDPAGARVPLSTSPPVQLSGR
jgi:hypothetical protein